MNRIIFAFITLCTMILVSSFSKTKDSPIEDDNCNGGSRVCNVNPGKGFS